MSNFDIVEIVRKMNIKNFRGVFMADELPNNPLTNECAVVNLDESRNEGTHWVCYWKEGNVSYIFDSYGGRPSKEIVTYLKNTRIFYNDKRIQDFNTVICGHLCLFVLNELSNDKSFDEVLNMLV